MAGPTDPRIDFAGDLTTLVHEKLTRAINYVPFHEEDSQIAVTAGWFCVEPPLLYQGPIQGSDEFSISYVGPQDSPDNANERVTGIRSMVISLCLFKGGEPFAFERG